MNTLIFIRWRKKRKCAYKIFYTQNFIRLNAFSVFFFSYTCAYFTLQHALVFNLSCFRICWLIWSESLKEVLIYSAIMVRRLAWIDFDMGKFGGGRRWFGKRCWYTYFFFTNLTWNFRAWNRICYGDMCPQLSIKVRYFASLME